MRITVESASEIETEHGLFEVMAFRVMGDAQLHLALIRMPGADRRASVVESSEWMTRDVASLLQIDCAELLELAVEQFNVQTGLPSDPTQDEESAEFGA